MFRKLLFGASIAIFASSACIGGIFAAEAIFRGTPDEIKQLITQEQTLGGAWTAQLSRPVVPSDGATATSSEFVGSVIPSQNLNFDLGEAGQAWRNAYIAGTLYASSTDFSGMTSTTTFPYGVVMATTGGNVGIGTASPNSTLTIRPQTANNGLIVREADDGNNAVLIGGQSANGIIYVYNGTNIHHIIHGGGETVFNEDSSATDFRISSDNNPYMFWIDASGDVAEFGDFGNSGHDVVRIGNGSATTTLSSGSPGMATSSFRGDTSIDNLFTGSMELPLDSFSDLIDVPVTSASAITDVIGYNFNLDGFPLFTLFGTGNSDGTVTSTAVGIGTQTPSSTLQVASDYTDVINNKATSTVYIGSDTMSPGCLVLELPDGGGKFYCTPDVANSSLRCTVNDAGCFTR